MVHRSKIGEKTTDMTTARMALENVFWSMISSALAVVAVMKANSPHADMAKPTLKNSDALSGTTQKPVATLPLTARKSSNASPWTRKSVAKRRWAGGQCGGEADGRNWWMPHL